MIESYEKSIGYTFKDKSLAYTALTHSSYVNESAIKVQSYERLEFLGDAVLEMVSSSHIFKEHPEMPDVEIRGAVYDIQSGAVEWLD